MKKAMLLMFSLSLLGLSSYAQEGDSWSLSLNKVLLLKSPVETAQPIATINKMKLKMQGRQMVVLTYKTDDAQQGWTRTFYFNSKNENSYKKIEMKSQSGTVSFPLKDLAEAYNTNTPVLIYTVSLPTDPALASTIRVRRVLVCEIQWR